MRDLTVFSHKFGKEMYITVEDFTKSIKAVEDSQNKQMQEKISDLKKRYARMEKDYHKLQVEHSRLLFDMDAVIEHEVDVKCKKLKEENKKLKEKIKDHQFYEEKLEHRIIEFEELLH